MITQDERQEIIKKGQEDGKRLFRVAEAIYKGLIILNWIGGLVGLVAAIIIFSNASSAYTPTGTMVLMGFGILAGTAIVCIVNYIFAVLMTHGAKVLVHLLFSNLAIMEGKQ